MTGSLFAASQRTVAPFRYDIVGSFLRSDALKEARKRFAQGRITQRELRQVEDAKIAQLVAKQKALGLRAVTDGEYRRNWWHLDFLWNLDGVRKVAAEQGSIAFKKRQTKAETIEIVSKVGFSGHPFIEDFKAVQTFAGDSPAKFTIPSPSMLHLITAVRNQQYKPLERYRDNDTLLADIAATYKKTVAAFYEAGCRYLQFDDTSWGEFCSEEKRAGYIARGFDMDRLERDYVSMINEALSERPVDMTVAMHICRGNFRSTWFSSGGYEPVAEILFGNTKVDGFFLEYDSDRAGDFSPLRLMKDQQVVLGLVSSKTGQLKDPGSYGLSARQPTVPQPSMRFCIHGRRKPADRRGAMD
ncbi:cobalamin-independent methionine synthase II family protein [Bilophila wadsworthia]